MATVTPIVERDPATDIHSRGGPRRALRFAPLAIVPAIFFALTVVNRKRAAAPADASPLKAGDSWRWSLFSGNELEFKPHLELAPAFGGALFSRRNHGRPRWWRRP